MKTIEQAAKDYAERNTLNTGADRTKRENSFKAGADFAQQWISVEDELPEERIIVLVRFNNSSLALAEIMDDLWIIYGNVNRDVAHWRPIELK